MREPAAVVVGLVGKPLGLRGEVFVHPDADVADDFPPGRTYLVVGQEGRHSPGRLTVADSRDHGGRLVVRFEGVDDRDAAEALRGVQLRLARNEVSLDPGSFWNDELLGRPVVDESGELVGVLESTLDGPAHDYLVVARPDGGEVLVPAVADLVDIQPDRIVVRAIPGLLDERAW